MFSSERFYQSLVFSGAAVIGGCAIVAACNSEVLRDPIPLERCYDEPLPVPALPSPPTPPHDAAGNTRTKNASPTELTSLRQYSKAVRRYNALIDPTDIPIHPAEDGSIPGNPGKPASVITKKVEGATVQVTTKIGQNGPYNEVAQGTGFLTTDNEDNLLVVTAAHVTPTEDLRKVTVSDGQGNVSDVVSGCYIFEDEGNQQSFKQEHGVDRDVTVLRLSKRIGASALSLANTPAGHGSWARFVNYQTGTHLGKPAEYNGLVVKQFEGDASIRIVTGIEGNRREEGTDAYTLLPGGSGGPVINAAGEVEGISTAVSEEPYPQGHINNIDLGPGATAKAGIVLKLSQVTSVSTIQAALDSQNY